MKQLKIFNNDKVAILDDDDYIRILSMELKWYFNSGLIKANQKYFAGEIIKSRNILLHRVIMEAKDPTVLVDHKDRDPFNNTRANLRFCTKSQNNANRVAYGKSGYKGVTWNKRHNKWHAQMKHHGNQLSFGYFESKIEAALEYNKHAAILQGEFAVLNVIK